MNFNMHLSRRPFLASLASLLVLSAFLVTGCGTASVSPAPKPEAAIVQTLAPTGTLRIGVYKGSPSSLVTDASGKPAGVAHDVGQVMATRLGVPAQVVVFDRVALVLEALKAGKVDMTFTNASPARQREFAFTQPLLSLELGYLVPTNGPIQNLSDVDKTGIRIGVSQGSSSQATLSGLFKQATIVAFDNLSLAKQGLMKSNHSLRYDIDGFATNKGILNEVLDDLNKTGQFKILDGRWGLEHMAIAIPLERGMQSPAVLVFVGDLGRELKASGDLTKMAERAGLRGTVNVDAGVMK
jgi:polar amino acid transport system substrate-binding protein